jgi:hypothetical protein
VKGDCQNDGLVVKLKKKIQHTDNYTAPRPLSTTISASANSQHCPVVQLALQLATVIRRGQKSSAAPVRQAEKKTK